MSAARATQRANRLCARLAYHFVKIDSSAKTSVATLPYLNSGAGVYAMRIEERLERLERENRTLKGMLGTLLAGAVGTALIAMVAGNVPAAVGLLLAALATLVTMERRRKEAPEVIRAQKIEVVGQDGITRVAIGETVEGAGAVATYDAEGRFIAALDVNGHRTSPSRTDRVFSSRAPARASQN